MKEIELVKKRKSREKHFLQSDGTIIAKIYDQDIHYLLNNDYVEIDNTLIEKDDCYVNKENDYKITFYKNEKKPLFKIEKNNFFIELNLKNSVKTKLKKKKKKTKYVENVEFKNIYENIDVQYCVLPSKVKESLILNKYTDKKIIFNLSTNLKLCNEDGYIYAYDETKEVFRFEKAFMEDANGKRNDKIKYELKRIDNTKYELEMILDDAWLKSEKISYPITIDPTIVNTNQDIELQDTYIYEGDTNINRNGHSILKAGIEKVNGQNIENRTLLKFDLPEIGTGSQIVDANIILTGYLPSNTHNLSSPKIVSIHRVTDAWNEDTATWENMNNKFENKAEALIECKRSSIDGTNLIPEIMYGNITSLVKKWYNDVDNYGVMIQSVSKEYIDEDYQAFFSKNNTIIGNSPKAIISITYRNQNGIESYLDYKQQSFSEGKGFVNTFNGNLTTIFNIGKTIGGQLPVKLKLVYNTNDSLLGKITAFGKGYKLNYDQIIRMSQENINNRYIEYVDADGTSHYLYNTNENENLYKDEDGLGLQLEKNEHQCIMKDKSNGQMIFELIEDTFYLVKILDTNGNEINIERDIDNRIVRITDKYNSQVSILYGNDEILISGQERNTKINLFEDRVSSIESILGITVFEYNDNELLSSIIDITGIKVGYEYYSKKPYRIKKVSQLGLNNTEGKLLNFIYGFDTTRITDENEKIETIIFNSNGNVLSRNNLKSDSNINGAYSLSQNYSSNSNLTNKIMSNHLPISYVKNYLKNTSFESNDEYFTNDDPDNLTLSYSTEYSYSGNRALKLVCLRAGRSIEQSVSLPKGSYYTFSGYFKADETVDIRLVYGDSERSVITESMELDQSDRFDKYSLSIYYSETATTDLKIIISFQSIGILYMDALQLEKGEIANLYNMIDNSDFSENLENWETKVYDNTGIEIETEDFFDIVEIDDNNNKALKVMMNPLYETNIQRKIKVNGKKDDLYTLTFWYKNEGVPECKQNSCNLVKMKFHTIGDEDDYFEVLSPTFNINNMWQFFSYTAVALNDFDEIELIFRQNTQINNLYITNISLYHNILSNFYEYDESGNMISIKNQNNEKYELKYDDNNKIYKLSDINKKNSYFEYDNEKKEQLINVISSNGFSKKFKYDRLGNQKSSFITKNYINELINGKYRIRNRGTNKYLKAELNMVLLEENNCSNTIWNLEFDENRIRLYYSVQPSYSISHSENALNLVKNGTTCFCLEKNENGSYYIYIQENDEKKYLKGENIKIELAKLNNEDPAFEFYFERDNYLFIENDKLYDDNGRYNIGSIDSNFNLTQYTVDQLTGQVTSETDANGNSIYYTYNDKKFLNSIRKGNVLINYIYNDQNMLSEINQGARKYKFTYDDFLKQKDVIIGDNKIFISNEYMRNNGKLKKITYGNNNTISYLYDEFGRIKNIEKDDNTYDCKYDCNNNLSAVVSLNEKENYKYDESNRLYEYKFEDGDNYSNFKVNYMYNCIDEVIKQKHKLGYRTVHNIENQFNEIDCIDKTIIDNKEFVYEYDEINRLKKQILPNNYEIEYRYIENGNRVTEIVKDVINGNDIFSYSYDNLYNITKILKNDSIMNEYFYDENSQLIRENNYILNEQIDYLYDDYGNILSKTTKKLTSNLIINTDNYQYNDIDWKDLLTNYNGINISYDDIGNPITIGNNISMTWKNGSILSSYSDTENNLNILFNHNVNGLRLSKNVNGNLTKYYYDKNDLIFEQRDNLSGVIYYLYDASGLIGLEYNNENYYYIKNLQNDIIGILNEFGEQIVSYEYDSWGNILSIKDGSGNVITNCNNIGIINPFRYRSYYYDSETELYYIYFRYYNPKWSRFINADTIISSNKDIVSFNLFTYASNNPVSYIDMNGHNVWDKICKTAKQLKKKVEKTIKTGIEKAKETINNVVNCIFGYSINHTVYSPQTTVIIPGISQTTGSDTTLAYSVIGKSDSLIHISSDGIGSEIEINGRYSNSSISLLDGELFEMSVGININEKNYSLITGLEGLDIYAGYQVEESTNEAPISTYTKYKLNIIYPIVATIGSIIITGTAPVSVPAMAMFAFAI